MLRGKSILLGISGGIAAYKAAELIRLMVKEGASVQAVMTAGAQRFITPLTLQVLSGQPVCTDLFNLEFESQIGHIQVARAAHLAVVAPATANIIAKLAAGIADDYLTTAFLATTAPILVCPAMNTKMYEHPITRRNLQTLRTYGYHLVEPDTGVLACKEEGAGRLAELSVIMEAVHRILTPRTLEGKRILVSAGPTWEAFDPVRFIANPSSGKMGYAVAAVAARRGADVRLVSGPTHLPAPQGVLIERVTTAEEMKTAIADFAPEMDAVIMAAAVSDYRPASREPQKVKKTGDEMTVHLVKNPDILAQLGKSRSVTNPQVLVGFAAETQDLIENAKEKLRQKNLDFIVANDLTRQGSGFGVDTNEVKIIDRAGNVSALPFMTKEEVAGHILDRVGKLFEGGEASGT
jgi:phosphopantothenoylcysteine decarboxylase/phosphopantothenate--cysteine ligase